MFACGVFPLCLLLLAWTFPARVSCQIPTLKEVSTEYVVVTWTRNLLWFGVDEFDVNFSTYDASVCNEIVLCTSITCTFNSSDCGVVFPCSPANITISGGSYTAPTVSLITGPEIISELALNITDGVEYISWANPSADSSPCYEKTAVKIYYDDKESISYFGREEESTNKPLCVEGSGEVEVWTEGGSGHSMSSWATITYSGSNVIDLVKFKACKPVNCTAIEVEWFYSPVCPDVDHIIIRIGQNSFPASVNTTKLTAMDLFFDHVYNTYIMAVGKYGEELDIAPSHLCETRCEVPENLAVETLNSSSLRVTWDPPLCPVEPLVPYQLTLGGRIRTTNATAYDMGGLDPFTMYYAEVQMDRDDYEDNRHRVTMFARTSAPTPSLHIDSVQSDYIEISWDSNYDGDDDASYWVTWGEDLQFEEETTEESFSIKDFNNTDEVYMVCLATVLDDREDLVSQTDCKLISDANEPNPLSAGAITGIVLGSLAVIALVVGAVIYASKKSKKHKTQTQELQER